MSKDGHFVCGLDRVEVMGRDVSVIFRHSASREPAARAIISAESQTDLTSSEVRFDLKPGKVFLFHSETEERIG